MTKEEYTQAKERATKYQRCENELNNVDQALSDIEQYNSFTLRHPYNTTKEVSFGINTVIRNNLISLLKEYMATIAGAMEEI
jgi:hypothetical protein